MLTGGLLVAFLTGMLLVVATYHGPWREVATDVMKAVPPVAATLLCLLAARRSDTRRVMLFWLLVGAAHLCVAVAQVTWAWLELVYAQEAPFPSVADAFWLGLYPLAFAGLVALVPSGGKGWRSAAASLLDGLLFGLAAGAMAWQFVGPQVHSQVGVLANMVVAAYPTGDILLLMGLVSLGLLPAAIRRLPAGACWLAVGLLVMVCADALCASREMGGSCRSGGWLGLLWPLAYSLVCMSALSFMGRPDPRQARATGGSGQRAGRSALDKRLAQLRLALPYLVVPIVAELLFLQFLSEDAAQGLGNMAMLAVSLLLMVLVLARQLLVVVENEQRVVAHISQLDKMALEKNRLVAFNRLASEIKHCTSVKEVARKGLELCLEVTRFAQGGLLVEGTAHFRPRFFGSPGLLRTERLELLQEARELATQDPDGARTLPLADGHEQIVIASGDGLSQLARIAVVPLLSEGRLVGSLCLGAQTEGQLEPEALKDLLWPVGCHLAGALANACRYEEARYLAERDAVTGLLNRRGMTGRIEEELTRSLRCGACFALVMMDLDKFKLINDTHGHAVGDQVLSSVSRVLVTSVRRSDVVARYGGDEFLALLPNTDAAEALPLVQRVQQAVSGLAVAIPEGAKIPVGMSYGVAVYPHDGLTMAEVLAAADDNLYRSKQSGGNCMVDPHSRHRVAAESEGVIRVLRGLVRAVASRDHYTLVHSDEVSTWSAELACALGLPHQAQRSLRIAGLLHDVGKLGVPPETLVKPGPLTIAEYEAVKQHVILGEEIIGELPDMREVLTAVAHHHERWDGSGYPRGAKGKDIPLLGRVLALCDAYSAMTGERPYRRPLTSQQAQRELRRVAGSQLDPDLVEAFIEMLGALGSGAAEVDGGASRITVSQRAPAVASAPFAVYP